MFSWEQDDLALVMKQCESDMAEQIQSAIAELARHRSGHISYNKDVLQRRIEQVCSKPFYERLKADDAHAAQCAELEEYMVNPY